MTGGRIILALDALMFGLFGALYWVIPEQMAAKVDVAMSTRGGIIDVQGIYGGLELGIAAFFAWCALKPERVKMGLVAGSFVLGSIALSRVVAMAHFGSPGAAVAGLVALDALGAVLNIAFWRRAT
ncbi:MAG: DUF4345 family protein [Kofleriaceae bacterium]